MESAPQQREVNIDELEERFKTYVYKHNGKITHERLGLLRALYANEGHYSVDELLELMSNQSTRISRATVYRTLDLLVACGLIRKLSFEGQETRYESALNQGHHDHIICEDCSKIMEFYSPPLERLQDEILAQYKFKMTRHVHQLYGNCLDASCPEKIALGKAKGLSSGSFNV